jgi:uroporphyrin-3 C-methyltransferase
MNETGTKPELEVLSVETNSPARRGSRLPTLLALLLALVALGASGWCWFVLSEAQSEFAGLRQDLAAVAARAERGPDPRLEDALRGVQQTDARLAGLDARVEELAESGAALQKEFVAISTADRRDWALAEAEYLERLAGQSLLMGREVRGALALLEAADAVLRDLDDPALHGARAALANDIAALRAVAQFDVEGVYLRLSALVAQVPALALMEHSSPQALAGATSDGSEAAVPGWWSRVTAVLGRYVVVRHRSESIMPLLPLAEESQLRMNLRLGLEQAKLALLAAEAAVYRDALAQVRSLAAAYLAAGAAANRAFIDEVDALSAVDVAPPLPDVSGSLRALRARPGASAAAPRAATPDAP